MNPKYFAGLDKIDTKSQKKWIEQSRRDYEKGVYKTRPVPKSYRHKRSSHVEDFKRIYGISMMNTNKIHRLLGVSSTKQKAILTKGKGAYFSSGSRPGQTPSSWGYARLASVLLGRAACKKDEHILLPLKCKELKSRSSKKKKSVHVASA